MTRRHVPATPATDLLDHVRAVAQRWPLVLLALLLGGVGGAAAATLAPESYTARATLFVTADATDSSLFERSQFALQQVASYAQLGTSAEVLDPVAAELGLSTASVADRVEVVNPVDTVVLEVSATDVTARGAAALADAVASRLSDTVDRIDSARGDQSVALDQTVPSPVPTTSTGPSRVVLAALGLLLGAGVGIAAAVLLAATRPRVVGVDDVRRAVGLPVVGQLPASVRRAARPGASELDATARTALREVVQNVRLLHGDRLPAVLLLARGQRAGDAVGVDAGLARAAVELGATCALVHADPESYDLGRSATDTDVAMPGAVALDPTGYDRVPVPDVVVASARRFGRTGAEAFFEDLRATYAVTVLQAASDSSPVPLRTVLPEAEAVVLVVRSGRTRVDALQALVGEVQSHGVEPLGVVLTCVPRHRRVLLRSTWTSTDVADREERPEARAHEPAQAAPRPGTGGPAS